MSNERSDAMGTALLEELYRRHHRELVRLGALAIGDAARAEDVVHDVFARLHRGGLLLHDRTKAAAYLRSAVLNGCRSGLRHRGAGERATLRLAGRPARPGDPADAGALRHEARATVMAAVRRLPARQRDCVLLRYYLDLSEAEIAETLGISAGTVKSSTARARVALAPALEELR